MDGDQNCWKEDTFVQAAAIRDKVTLTASSANPTTNSVHSCPQMPLYSAAQCSIM